MQMFESILSRSVSAERWLYNSPINVNWTLCSRAKVGLHYT